jgi:2'-hydroxyisoflavone reductase
MKLLILGGTVFLGRHLVQAALARGHEVTLFNRGQHNPNLFPNVEKLRGDRDNNLSSLKDRTWDAVIDTSGYIPRLVQASAQLLKNNVNHYTFISSISAYQGLSLPNQDETASVGKLSDETIEEITTETYGPLKALCEEVIKTLFPSRALIIRPGLIVGSHDPTDRFTYWVHRVARGGEVLAPGRPERQIQIIDVRDLAEWTVKMAETQNIGIYNAIGPDYHLTMQHLLNLCKSVSGSDARFCWVDEELLEHHGVEPWTELPQTNVSSTTDDFEKLV